MTRALLGRTPLRVRLVAALVLLVAVGLLLSAVASTSALSGYLQDRVDAQLRQAAGARGLDPARPGGPRPGGPPRRPPGEFFFAVLDRSGRVVEQTTDADGGAPRLTALSTVDGVTPGVPFLLPDADPDDPDGRWRALLVRTPEGRGTLVLALDLEEPDRTVDRLRLLQLTIGLVVLGLVSAAGYAVVRSSLRGLADVEEAAAAVAAGDLERRVPERDVRTEIGSLAASFNRMVSQVQTAFATRAASEDRLRRFVADAGHELRTPLTSIRGFAELHRQGAVTDPADVTRLLARIEAEAVRMGMLVEDLLALARLDEQRPLSLVPVDLTVLAADAVHDARAVEPDRPLTLEADDDLPIVEGDERRLRQVFANLLSNALRHTPAGTPVHVRIGARPAERLVVLEVADEGPGMPQGDAARVFERFYRADVSRTRASGGAGLGLSIVASLVHAHGGRLELDTAPGRGATFRVLLPARPR